MGEYYSIGASNTNGTILAANLIVGIVDGLWAVARGLEPEQPLSVQFTSPSMPGQTFDLEVTRWAQGNVTVRVMANAYSLRGDLVDKIRDLMQERFGAQDVSVTDAFGQTQFDIRP